MPFDTNGTFNRVIVGGWQADAAAGTKITAIRHDAEDDGFATGLSTCITRDGHTTVLANIPMNGKKIINLGEPGAPTDAATKNYVDTVKTFTTGLVISGAGPTNGFINFASPTGVNGIGWATADMSWIGRVAVTNQSPKALAINDAKDGSGTDVFSIDEAGRVNSSTGHFANNLVFDAAAAVWRAPAAGIATLLAANAGAATFYSNDTATAAPYLTPALRAFATIANSGGNATLTLDKTDGNAKSAGVQGGVGGVPRWLIRLGEVDSETGVDRVGSSFRIYSFNNAGTAAYSEFDINRSTHAMSTGGGITSPGAVTASSFSASSGLYKSTAGSTILSNDGAGGGSVSLRPNGSGTITGNVYVTTAGDWYVPNGSVFVSGGGVAGSNGIALNVAGFGDFARAGTTVGSGFCRFLNNNGIIGSITSATATSVAYATTSDERLKDVIGDYAADAAIAIIRADPVKAFTWKASGERAVGWLAQRSYAIDKNLAVPPETDADGRQVDGNDRWGIDYGSRTPYLWAALAAALDKIDALTARIEALEAAP